MVIVCGSSSSWILDNMINNHGGLYGRVTCEMKIHPFNLNETERFFESKGINMSRYDITEAYDPIITKNADFHTSRIAVRREMCYIIPMALRGGESSVNIAKKIRELRENVGENRTEFSKHTGIPVRTIEDWESGRRTPPEYIPRLLEYQLKYEEIVNRQD